SDHGCHCVYRQFSCQYFIWRGRSAYPERRTQIMRLNQRQRAKIFLILSAAFLLAVVIGGYFCYEGALVTDFSRKNMAPCLKYPFGTDWLGRDMFYRTLTGLSMSIL